METIIVILIILLRISKCKDLALFYHIGAVSDRLEEIISRQWTLIKKCGLYNKLDTIFVGIVGNYSSRTLEKIKKDEKVILINNFNLIESQYEDYTLHFLYHYAKYDTNSTVIYMHSRGMTYGKKSNRTDDWTKCMEYFILEKWKRNLEYIENYYTLGCQLFGIPYPLNGPGFGLIYYGNFWWTTTKYINTLPEPHIFSEYGKNRFGSELWIPLNFVKNPDKHLILYHTDGRYSSFIKQQRDLLTGTIDKKEYDNTEDVHSYHHETLPRYR